MTGYIVACWRRPADAGIPPNIREPLRQQANLKNPE
jgi:hypothetical protein